MTTLNADSTAQQRDEQIRTLELQLVETRAKLAELKRAKPREQISDYELRLAATGSPVRLSSLFGGGRDLLLIHNMGVRCSYCTLWADVIAGVHFHLAQRCAVVLVTPDAPDVAAAFAASRRWPFTVASARGTTLSRDLGYESPSGAALPGVSGLHLADGGVIERVQDAPFGPGDAFCPVWHLFDLLDSGAKGWEPTHSTPAPRGS